MSDQHPPTRELRRPSPLAMSPDERERFLSGNHVGIIAHGRSGARAPFASPVWYSYEPGGDVAFVTAADSLKARHLPTEDWATLIVQQESPPQRFVSVSGPVRVTPGASPGTRRTIARRYLPDDAVDGFLAMTPGDLLVTVSLTPTIWRSSDFGKLTSEPLSR